MRLGWLQESWEAGVASHRFTHRARWQAALAQVDGLCQALGRALYNLVVTLGAIGIALRAGIEAHEVTYPRATAPQIMTAPPTSGSEDDEYDDEEHDDD